MSSTPRLPARRATLVLALLVAATFGSLLVHDQLEARSSKVALLAVLLIASGKIHLVMTEFMDIRFAPPILRWFCAAWLVVTTAVLALLFLLA